MQWASSNPWRVQIEENGRERTDLLSFLQRRHLHPSSPALWHQSPWFSGLQTQTRTYITGSPGSRILGLGLELYHRLSWASSLQTQDCGISQPPSLSELIPHIRSLLCASLCILLVLFLWRPWLTQRFVICFCFILFHSVVGLGVVFACLLVCPR